MNSGSFIVCAGCNKLDEVLHKIRHTCSLISQGTKHARVHVMNAESNFGKNKYLESEGSNWWAGIWKTEEGSADGTVDASDGGRRSLEGECHVDRRLIGREDVNHTNNSNEQTPNKHLQPQGKCQGKKM